MGFNPTQDEIDKTAADYLQGLNGPPAPEPAPDTAPGLDPQLAYLADLDKQLAEDYPEQPSPAESPLPIADKTGPKVSDAIGQPEPEPEPVDPNDPHTQYENQEALVGSQEAPEQEEPPAEEDSAEAEPPPAAATPAPPPAVAAPKGIQARELASTKGDEAKLVSKAPAWYEAFEPPPKHTGGPQAAGAMFGGLLKAIGSFAAADSAHNKSGREAAIGKGFGDIFGGMSGAAEAKINAPEQDYQNRLNAAGKQAQMVATLRSGQGQGNQLGLLNYDLAERKFKHLLDNEATKAAAEAELAKPESQASKELRDAYVAAGIFKPEVAAKMSGKQMMAARVGAQGQAASERNSNEHTRMSNMRYDQWIEKFRLANTEHDRREALDQINKIAAEDRSEDRLNEQAQIPGWKFAGKSRPNTAAVETARKIADATERIQSDAERLAELKKLVSTRGWLTPGFLQGTIPDEDRELMDEMHAAVFDLRRANAQLGDLGAPQAFEETMLEKLTPDANGIQSFLNDGTAWAAQGRTAHRLAKARMKSYYFVPDDGSEAAAPPPAAGPHKTVTTRLNQAGQAGKEIARDVVGAGKQVVHNAQETAAQVAPGAVEAAKKVMVRVNGGQWMEAPAAGLETLKKKWGAKLEVQP